MSGEVRSYRPSNGTEGMAFMDHFCGRCARVRWREVQAWREGGPNAALDALSAAEAPRYDA